MTCDVTYDSDGKTVGDAELFAGMKGAMKILNFTEAEQFELWKIVATVMHLGNIVFLGLSTSAVPHSSSISTEEPFSVDSLKFNNI